MPDHTVSGVARTTGYPNLGRKRSPFAAAFCCRGDFYCAFATGLPRPDLPCKDEFEHAVYGPLLDVGRCGRNSCATQPGAHEQQVGDLHEIVARILFEPAARGHAGWHAGKQLRSKLI